MIYLFIIVNILLLIFCLKLYKDLLNPVVLFTAPWILSTIGLLFSDFYYDINSLTYIFMTIGSVLFVLGFFISYGFNKQTNKNKCENKTYRVKFKSLKCIVIFETIFTILLYTSMTYFIIKNYNGNIYNTIFLSDKSIPGSVLFSYGRNVILVISIYFLINYKFVSNENKKFYKKILIIQSLILFFTTITRLTRNGMFFSFLPIIFCFLIIFNKNNKDVLKYGTVTLLLFFVIFTYVAISQSMFSDSSIFEVISKQFQGYLSSPISALQIRMDQFDHNYLFGQNTFRFFIAIFDKLFGTNNALDLVQEYTQIGKESVTNVYTFYYFYIKDFGWIYALIIQFLLGLIYGLIYKKIRNNSIWPVFFYSILMYPLIFQFFQDQYLSIFSSWLQLIIVAFILEKSNLVMHKYNYSKY